MGRALTYAADLSTTHEVPDAADQDDEQPEQKISDAQVVLISDMQQGSNIETLQAYAWPEST